MSVFGSEEGRGGLELEALLVSVVGYGWCYFVKCAEVNYLRNKTGSARLAWAGIAQSV